jgi:hypothetical protein
MRENKMLGGDLSGGDEKKKSYQGVVANFE